MGDADGRSLAAGVRLSGKELGVDAITGERRAVVEKLDALVKSTNPCTSSAGGPDAADADHINPNLPLPYPSSKSVH